MGWVIGWFAVLAIVVAWFALTARDPSRPTLRRRERDMVMLARVDRLSRALQRLATTTRDTGQRHETVLQGMLEVVAPEKAAETRKALAGLERTLDDSSEDYGRLASVRGLDGADGTHADGARKITDAEHARLVKHVPAAGEPARADGPVVAIRPQVLTTILDECRRHPRVETGGILLGERTRWGDSDVLDLRGHIGPGDNVSRHVAMFRGVGGEQAVEQYLWYHYRFPETAYLGEWHKHPSGVVRPSGGDYRTVVDRMLPTEPELLIPIVAAPEVGSDYQIRFYWITRQRREFMELPAVVLRTLSDLPAKPPRTGARGMSWRERVPERFRIERVLLERLGKFEATPDDDDGATLWVHVETSGGVPMMFRTPAEYPSEAPEVYGFEGDAPVMLDIEGLLGQDWEPRYYLVHAVAAWQMYVASQRAEAPAPA